MTAFPRLAGLSQLAVALALYSLAPVTSAATQVAADNSAIRYSGRSEGIGTDRVTVGWSGARERLRFRGSGSVAARIEDDSGDNYAMAWIDGKPGKKFRLNSPDAVYTIAEGLDAGEHTVEVVRITECFLGLTHFRGFELDAGAAVLPWEDEFERRIEFIGDSITCGYGVESGDPQAHFTPATENFCLGYSGLTARALDADCVVVARSGIGMVRDYNGPRDGNPDAMPVVYPETFYMQPEPKWDFSRFTPDVVCLNLGTNDFSTTGVNLDKFVATYADFLRKLLSRYPAAKVVVLAGPMNNSDELKTALHDAIARLGDTESKRVHFLELSSQGKVGFGADYHPNRAQSGINAGELTAFLADLMNWR